MAGENLGASFGIDVTNLKAGLAQANRLIRESESEFKAAAAGMGDWSDSAEGLEARLKHLNTAADLQQKKVTALQSEYDRLIAGGLDPTDRKAIELRTSINKETEALNKSLKEIEKQTKALDELEDASDGAAESNRNVADSAEDAADGFTVAKGAIAGFIANGLTALVGAAKNAITNVLGLAESTREYRTELAKISTIANEAGVSTDYIKDKWHDLTATLGDEGAVGEGLNNLLTAGFSGDKLDEVTKLLEGASIKWKDTLKFEGLSDSIQEIIGSQGLSISGSAVELFERMGVDIEKWQEKFQTLGTEEERQNMILQTLADGGLAEVSDAYREQNADLIAANKANSEYQDNLATLGGKVEPITTKVREGFNQILEKVLEFVEGVDMDAVVEGIGAAFDNFINNTLPKIMEGIQWFIDNKDAVIAGLAGIGAGFAAFKVVTLIQSVVGAMKGMTLAQAALNAVMAMNPIGLVVAAIAALVAAFVYLWNNCDSFREFWLNLWEGIKTTVSGAIETVKGIFNNIIEFVKSNWQGLLLLLVNPFAGAFKLLYDNCEGFRNFVDNFVESVKNFFVTGWNSIVTFFTQSVPNFFKNLWTNFTNLLTNIKNWGANLATNGKNAAVNFFNNVINIIKNLPGKVWEFLTSTISKVANFATNLKNKGVEAAKGLFDSIVNKIKELPGQMLSLGSDIVKGLWNGINDMADWIGKKIKGFGEGVLSGIKDFFGIKSPSRVMKEQVGKNLALGIGEGFEDNIKGVNAAVRSSMDIGNINSQGNDKNALNGNYGRNIVINQHNTYSQAHSRYELYKSKQQTAAAVKLALST